MTFLLKEKYLKVCLCSKKMLDCIKEKQNDVWLKLKELIQN